MQHIVLVRILLLSPRMGTFTETGQNAGTNGGGPHRVLPRGWFGVCLYYSQQTLFMEECVGRVDLINWLLTFI